MVMVETRERWNAWVINKDRDRGVVNNDPVPEIEGEENQGN